MSMQERRKNLRRKMPLEIPLLEQDNDQTLGFLSDLSSQGFRMSSDGPMTGGTELELKMMLPDEWSETRELDFTAQCCWWEDGDENDSYHSGFQIIDINQEDAELLRQLLEDHGIPVRD